MTQTEITEIELSEVDENVEADAATVVAAKDISLIQDLPVTLNVAVGEMTMSVKELYQLKVGQVVKIDTEVTQPVKLMFDKQLVAEGVLVAVGDHYGVEITSLAEFNA